MSGSPLEAVLELTALPELAGLHPDDLASLARQLEWPGETAEAGGGGDAPEEDARAEADAVHFLLYGSAAPLGDGARFEAPALVGAVEALAGAPGPGPLVGEGARIARLDRAAFRALLADVFELWLVALRHALVRLRVAEPEPGAALPPGAKLALRPDDAELVQRIRLLADCELLGDLRVHTLGRLARGMEERRLGSGVPLWEEGAYARHCFLVLEGSFARSAGPWLERPLAVPRGALLGLRGMLADERRTSRVVATDAARVLCLPREHLIDELEDDPDAAEALIAAVARRVLRAEAAAR